MPRTPAPPPISGVHAPRAVTGRPDARRDARSVRTAYESFLAGGDVSADVDPVVADSWRRSVRSGVDPDRPYTESALSGDDLAAYRDADPLAALMPVVRELVVDVAADDGLVVAVSDDAGRLLWVEGNRAVRDDAARVGFVEGSVWREDRVGTNAPGTALAARRPVQVLGMEHFARTVQAFSCAAVPIHEPETGRVLGTLDVTGRRGAASGSAVLPLLGAAVLSVERELARGAIARRSAARQTPAPAGERGASVAELDVLGAAPVLRLRPGVRHRLPLLHAEILVLLAAHPQGLSADELAVLLQPGIPSGAAIRAEVAALRRVVGPLVVGSRAYRLGRPLLTDADVVRDRFAVGDVQGALSRYRAPLLARSTAPAVEALRFALAAEVRAAVVSSGDPDSLDAWTRTDDGAEDEVAWVRLEGAADHGSPLWARARAHVDLLDDELD